MEADSSGGVCNGLTINDAQFIMCSDYSMMNIWAGYRHYMGSGYFTEWTQFLSSSSGFSAITVTDWNNATQTGFYTSDADADNAPYPYTYDTCFGFVIANTSAAQQFVFRESKASNGIVDNALYTRSVRLNSRPVYYGEWQLVNKQAAADVPITAISGMTATTVQEALEVTNKAVMEALGGLPPVKVHCSLLAEQAVHAALWDYAQKNHITIEGLKPPVNDVDELEEAHKDEA